MTRHQMLAILLVALLGFLFGFIVMGVQWSRTVDPFMDPTPVPSHTVLRAVP